MGANYSEACDGESAKDFVHKLKIAAKEARETKFFLRLLLETNGKRVDGIYKNLLNNN
ncbi:MAG: four helix bundle protein [Patescibacteria group bacterium]